MRVLRIALAALVSMVLLSGCFYTHVVAPLDTNVDKTVLGQKTGRASSQSVLWVAAWGDAGTAAAAKNGGISTVNHMDREILSVFFGIYTETTTIVYGD
ncbi:MAG TPA: TRL-like family protein [Nitrospirota bacterium]